MPQLIAGLLLLLLFALFPQLDVALSSIGYRAGEGFVWAQAPAVLLIYRAVNVLAPLLIAGLLLALLAGSLRPSLRPLRARAGFLLLVLALGPGLIAHPLLKDHWGRPRPVETQVFGGTQPLVPAAVPSRYCDKNCSFVSGHAVMGFYLLAFGYAWPRQRRRWHWLGIAAGVSIGAVRMLQGKHFASDVLGSYLVVLGTCLMVSALWRRWRWPALD
ncbi:Membrane-associated enzyme, PAP2 (acid phosphatase) superfamily [Solimonas aquatica]|uniref:Membrane-associated enzyme, PAP2 (Acid phosphatase) superfamily n=1 Tax=Solimonas aquatica TaxID=489703 RepID=A0A1H9FS48_9GAMM|nr:phosphatase PAP2 family protein [Solimonas aquatica]SEQ40707.1 Membrane-associated enzyme, PAP2 (acid phosphatase) superfamily [Solimonas aquatica]